MEEECGILVSLCHWSVAGRKQILKMTNYDYELSITICDYSMFALDSVILRLWFYDIKN